MKKKIVFVGNSSWGMFNFRKQIIEYSKNKEYEIYVISPQDAYSLKLRELGINYIDMKIDSKGKNPFIDLGTFISFCKLYKEIQPDLIFHYTIKPIIYGSLAANLLNIKNIAITTGLGFVFINKSWTTKLIEIMYKIALKKTKEIWFLNENDKDTFKSHGILDRIKYKVIPGEGIDTTRFTDKELVITDNFQFIFVGRVLSDKGILEFIEAARKIIQNYKSKKIFFQIVGSVDALNPAAISISELENLIDDDCINYMGQVDDVVPVLQNSGCLVLPSYREGIPFTLMEASLIGLPVIASDVPGCRDVVIDKITGYLCRVKDSDSLYQKMKQVLDMSYTERVQMGKEGQKYIESTFSFENVLSFYQSAYRQYVQITK